MQALRRRTPAVVVRAEKDKPSPLFPEAFVNAITVAVKNSPLNAGKLALAKAQAGQYDEAAVKAKIQSLIKDNPVRGACHEIAPLQKG